MKDEVTDLGNGTYKHKFSLEGVPVKVSVWHNGRLLVEGEDYELEHGLLCVTPAGAQKLSCEYEADILDRPRSIRRYLSYWKDEILFFLHKWCRREW